MAKAVLVMDMPENCYRCPLCDDYCHVFAQSGDTTDYYKQKPDWCPLIPEPLRMGTDDTGPMGCFVAGWNACLDELEGRT